MAALIDNKPDLSFSFLGGKLIVKDVLTEYATVDLTKYICIDYIVLNSSEKIEHVILRENIEDESELGNLEFLLEKDGSYDYYRILVPRVKKYIELGIIKPYNIFYYNKSFYYTLHEVSSEELDLNDKSVVVEVDLENLYNTLYSGIDTLGDNDVLYAKYLVFSYELIKKAFVEEQKLCKNGLLRHSKFDRKKRDILLTIIFILRNYINQGKFEEADILIEEYINHPCISNSSNKTDLPECCCGDSQSNKKKDFIIYLNQITTDDLISDPIWRFGSSFPIKFYE